jgi:lysophospholipase
MLIFASSADRVVDTRAIERFASRLRSGRLIVIDGAEHEILVERDALREQFWAAFDKFIPGVEGERAAVRR